MTFICDRCGYTTPSSNRFNQHLHRKNICKPKIKDIDIEIVRDQFNKLSNIKQVEQKKPVKNSCKTIKYYCDRCGYNTNNKKYFRGHVNRKNTCIPELKNIDIKDIGLKYNIILENTNDDCKVNKVINNSPIMPNTHNLPIISNANTVTNNFPVNSKVNTITSNSTFNSKVNNKINMKEFYKNFEDKSNVITLHIIERDLGISPKEVEEINTNEPEFKQENKNDIQDKLNLNDYIQKNVLDELNQSKIDLDSDTDDEILDIPNIKNGTFKCLFCEKQLKTRMSYKRHLNLCQHKKTKEICKTIDNNTAIPNKVKEYIHSTINNNVNNLVKNSITNKVINNTYNKTNNIQIHCYGLKDLSFITNEFINSITKLPPASYLLVKDKNSNIINTNVINNNLVT